jgi:hypothetical protein
MPTSVLFKMTSRSARERCRFCCASLVSVMSTAVQTEPRPGSFGSTALPETCTQMSDPSLRFIRCSVT